MRSLIANILTALAALTSVAHSTRENAQEYEALCAAYQAETGTIDPATFNAADAVAEVPAAVKALYATTIPDAHYDNGTFGVLKTENEFTTVKNTIKNEKNAEKLAVYTRPPECPAKRATHTALERLYNSTKAIAEEAACKQNELQGLKQSTEKFLKAAVFKHEMATEADQAAFDNRANACNGGGNAKAASQNLAQALACVCGTASTSNGICVEGENTANYGTGANAAAALTAYKAIVAKCQPAGEAKKVTAELLTAVVTQVESVLGNKPFTGNSNNGRYVLGNGNAVDCNGGTTSATCIDYTKAVGTGTFHKVKWVENMLQATKELKKAYTIRADLAKMQAKLQAAEAQAWQLRDTLAIATITAAHAAETIKPSKRQPKETIESKEAECNTKDKDTDCKPPCA
ncbi:variant surface glycoprotein (VSG), putative [Trypanosoma equiperdum]|uniref:Variant surface glycoprotein (VSG), putative n=1 Tax=Trypanosoma equiperdum TaxID=5694 RepID=A0A1G4I202_TRYEQ|nr:variant surface glycoprotein (VSG), putative [Trypanosoma equiperdum]